MTSCARSRELIHERLDGPVDALLLAEVEDHLRACADCREVAEGLERVQRELRSLPEIPFPSEALDEVFARTIRRRAARPRRLVAWSSMAAAAAVLAILILLRFLAPQPPVPSPQELAQAERDARLALAVAAQALQVTEDATVQRVLGGEVAPILRKIPVRWDKAGEPAPIRSRT
jgi:predicted anti-sigma-YlaC factor YlaD